MKRVNGFLILLIGLMMIIQNRYRLLNFILGQRFFRKLFIGMTLRVPLLKNRFMQNAFRFQS